MILEESTLVLNKHWVPIAVTSVLRAVVKLHDGAARVVDPADYAVYDFGEWVETRNGNGSPCLRTPTLEIPVPEVIVLRRYGGIPTRVLAFSRWNLFRRDRFTCQYCGKRPGKDQLTIDHIVPRSRGGSSGWQNCVVACGRCNTRKGNRTLEEVGYRLSRPAKRPRWSEQLVDSDEGRRDSWKKFLRGG